MKMLVALCVLAFVAAAASQATSVPLSPEKAAKLFESIKICVESSHVDMGLVIKARGGDFADDEHLDEFFTCMFKQVGFIDDEGTIQRDEILAKAPSDINKEDIDKVLTACAKVQKEPKTKIATAAYKCYLTETPVKIQLIPA